MVAQLDEQDFVDDDGSQMDGAHLTYMTSLAQILYNVLKRFYTIKSARVQDTVELATMAQPIMDALETWRITLPHTLTMESLPQTSLSSACSWKENRPVQIEKILKHSQRVNVFFF